MKWAQLWPLGRRVKQASTASFTGSDPDDANVPTQQTQLNKLAAGTQITADMHTRTQKQRCFVCKFQKPS